MPWRHVHPLTPLLRGGFALIAIGSYAVSREFDRIVGQEPGPDLPAEGIADHLGIAAALLLGGILLIVAYSWISWQFTRFRLTDTLVEVRAGVLARSHRQVRYDRIQSVDVARPVLARITGLSEVIVRSAGGGEHLRLAYLSQTDAFSLRAALARHADDFVEPAADDHPTAGDPVPGRPWDMPEGASRSWLRVSSGRLIAATLGTGPGLVFVIGGLSAALSWRIGIVEIAAALAPVVLSTGTLLIGRLLGELDFVLTATPTALVLRHGLTETRNVTIPNERVQAVKLHQPLLWRLTNWWRIEVNVAGSAIGEDPDSTVLPVGTLAEAIGVLGLALGDVEEALVHSATSSTGAAGGFATGAPNARWLDPFGWRRIGYQDTPSMLVIRGGAWHREVVLVPYARMQSFALRQGLVQRQLDLATFVVASTRGPVRPALPHLRTADAEALLTGQSVLASRARLLGRLAEEGGVGVDHVDGGSPG
ncbi:MAG: PH domain-containing protein [Nostocoides sp.]